jgi:hypothetical protein
VQGTGHGRKVVRAMNGAWKVALLCGLGIVLGQGAHADADAESIRSPFALGVQVGTLGVGPVVTVSPWRWLTLRGDMGFLNFDYDATAGETDYVVEMDYQSGGVMADLCPFGGPIRFTGGVRLGENTFSVEAEVSDAWEIGGAIYNIDALDSVTGTVTFDDSVVPYFGIGFGNPARAKRFLLMFDVGVTLQTATIDLEATGNIAGTAAFQARLAQEEADLQDDLDQLEFYPVVRFVLGYRF